MFTFTQKHIDRLSHLISRRTGYYVQFTYLYKQGRTGNWYLEIQSNDLVQHAGIMAPVYKSLIIDNFGGGWCEGEHPVYCLPLHFSYDYKTGGSNGHELERCWYNVDNDEWIIGNPIKENA